MTDFALGALLQGQGSGEGFVGTFCFYAAATVQDLPL